MVNDGSGQGKEQYSSGSTKLWLETAMKNNLKAYRSKKKRKKKKIFFRKNPSCCLVTQCGVGRRNNFGISARKILGKYPGSIPINRAYLITRHHHPVMLGTRRRRDRPRLLEQCDL